MEINSSLKRICVMGTALNSQKGAVMVIFTLLLLVLLGFAGLAIDVGSWYGVKAELSKSVDAAAMAGAKNISNPYVDPLVLAKEFGSENFPAGYLGTKGTATFNAYADTNHSIRVTGSVIASAYLAQLFGVNQVVSTNTGAARKNNVEIMLVLDRSGSMAGKPISDLKAAAKSFIAFFDDTQDDDKVGLISFATGVKVNFPLGNNFVTPITTAINSMAATGATNAEDALAQAGGAQGLPDQSGLPGDQRVQQFLIFFSDGNPTAFRGKFKNNGVDNIDAVVCGTGNTCTEVYNQLGKPDSETWLNIDPRLTGDGKAQGTSKCTTLPPLLTTKWYVFSDYPMPPPNTGFEQCFIPTVNTTRSGRSPNYTYTLNSVTGPLAEYVCDTARQMAIDKAQDLKNKYVKIYTIGLGTTIDKTFLSQIASGSTFEYYAPTSSDLQAIFNAIAKDIKLRLVQ